MAITVDWPSGVITIPKADLTLLEGTKYQMDADTYLKAQIKEQEATAQGIHWPDILVHATEVEIAGITYARFMTIVDPYTVVFEMSGPAYSVDIIGANTNIQDVLTDVSGISARFNNSAGLIDNTLDGKIEEMYDAMGLGAVSEPAQPAT